MVAQQKLTHSCIFTSYFTSKSATLLKRHRNWNCARAIANPERDRTEENQKNSAHIIWCDVERKKKWTRWFGDRLFVCLSAGENGWCQVCAAHCQLYSGSFITIEETRTENKKRNWWKLIHYDDEFVWCGHDATEESNERRKKKLDMETTHMSILLTPIIIRISCVNLEF